MALPVNTDEWIQIFPAGKTVGHDGRGPYLLDNAAGVITASMRKLVDLAIDRDHVTDIAAPGTPAPAAGWIKEMKADADGIHARIEWTPPAQEQLKNREYRYISPTFLHEPGGRVTRILRASLTNDPNFEMKAVAASDRDSLTTTETTMEKLAQDLAALLGLEGDNVSSDAIIEAVTTQQDTLAAIKAAFEVSDEATTADAIIDAIKAKQPAAKATAAANKGEPDPAKYVPIGVVSELQTQVTKLTNDAVEAKATAAVDAALKTGKLIPAQRDWALGLASKDAKAFEEYVAKAPTLIKDSGLGHYTAETAAAQGGLTQVEADVASQLGIAPAAFKAETKKTA